MVLEDREESRLITNVGDAFVVEIIETLDK